MRVCREGGGYVGREEGMEGGRRVWREGGGWGKGKGRDRREVLSLLSFPGLSQLFTIHKVANSLCISRVVEHPYNRLKATT